LEKGGLWLVAEGERSEGRGWAWISDQNKMRNEAPAATGRRGCGARRRSLTLRGERLTPDGTQDVTEPRRGRWLQRRGMAGRGPTLTHNDQPPP